jgi:two-component sensor histidine kinase
VNKLSDAPPRMEAAPVPGGRDLPGGKAEVPRRQGARRLRQAALLAAAVLTPLALLGISGWRSWDSAWRGAEVEGTRTAEAAAEYAQRLLEAQLLRIERANDVLEGLSDAEIRAQEPALHAALRRITARPVRDGGDASSPGFYLFVYDRASMPLVASTLMPVPAGRPAINRQFASILGADAALPFHVGTLFVGRDTGRQFFSVFGRRERTGNGLPEGAYDGAIAASLYIDTINPVLRSLASMPGNVVTLLRADGEVLARSIGVEPGTGTAPADNPVVPAIARGEKAGVLRAVAAGTEGERMVAFRMAGGSWPVVAVAERSRAAVVAAWRRAMLPQAVLAAASSVLLLLLAQSVIRRTRELEATNGTLEQRVAERTREAADRERLLRLAQQAAAAASWSWDPATNRVRWSPEMFLLLGLDPSRDAGAATFEGFMSAVHPADREALRQACEDAMVDGSMALEFRILQVQPGGGRLEKWLLCRAGVFPSADGRGQVLIGIDVDITDRKRSEERLEAAANAMEGFVYEWDMADGRVFRTLGVTAMLGEPLPATAEAWMQRIHPEDSARVEEELRACSAAPSRERYEMEYRVRRADGGWAWVWDRARVVRDPRSGAVLRSLGGAIDITARRLAEERQALLMREVDHRGKNALAVVRAALRLTRSTDLAAYRSAIEGRVDALARAQSLLAETGWQGSDLRHLLGLALQPFLTASQAVFEGPDVELAAGATQPMTMVLHELATNATKYGALSSADGVLRVTWRVEGDALRLRWEEAGGPAVAGRPASKGFGSRVVDTTVCGQLGGSVAWSWAPTGLVVELALPVARTVERVGAPAAEPVPARA